MATNHKNETITLEHDGDLSSETRSDEFRCRLDSDAVSTLTLHQVLDAYAGLARPGKYYAPSRNLPSMAPVGMLSFGVASMYLGLLLAQVRGVTVPNYSVVCAWFVGGLGLLTAGLWEFVLENSHGCSVMIAYGLYWWSSAALYTPSFGIATTFLTYCHENVANMPAEYSTYVEWGTEMLLHAVAMWTLALALFSFTVVSTLLKSTVAFIVCITLVGAIFVIITAGYITGSLPVVKTAGWFSFAAGAFALYNGMAGLMTKENSYIQFKAIPLPKWESTAIPDPEK